MNLILKLILNSLYGFFGMKKDFQEYKLVTSKEFLEIELFHNLYKVFKIKHDVYLVRYDLVLNHESFFKKTVKHFTTYLKHRKLNYMITLCTFRSLSYVEL